MYPNANLFFFFQTLGHLKHNNWDRLDELGF